MGPRSAPPAGPPLVLTVAAGAPRSPLSGTRVVPGLQGAGWRRARRRCGRAARLAEAEGRAAGPAGLAAASQGPPPALTQPRVRRGRAAGRSGGRVPGNMAAADLAQIPDVDIDPDGVFKYVLIRVNVAPAGESKEIVRGYKWAEYHADIYDKVAGEMQQKGYGCECLGGGRISHQSQDKKIHVYGYSMGFGRAQHSISTEKIKARYPDYEVTWADDGY
ncbi:14 kDa phosphohistidine phosphatase [Myotis myotis]|uniref:14 kDa phosphohistidine phosphatase n=1 Tax=Myotis myotis TaxID=51298 RepID=UPI00174AF199|nr:14 kDa phosphohistidine phosphatase [Myotis myotis]